MSLSSLLAAPALAQPDLTLSKSHAGNFVVGTNGTYSFNVTNSGLGSTLFATTVVDTLPGGLSFVSGAGSGWTFTATGQVVACVRLGFLAPGASSAFTLTVAVDPVAYPLVVNRAYVSVTGETNTSNNSAVDPTIVDAVDLAMDKSHAGSFTVGVNGTYTVSVMNVGTASTFGALAVVDTLPAGLTFVSGGGSGWSCSASGQIVTCSNPGPISPSGASSFPLTVFPWHPAVPSVTNVTRVNTTGDISSANDADADPTVVIGRPDLTIDKSHNGNFFALTSENFDFVVRNAGSASTSGAATVLDTLPAGLTFVSGAGAGWSFSATGQIVTCVHAGAIAIGDTTGFAMTVAVGVAAIPSVSNSATVYTAGDPNPDDDRDTDVASVLTGPQVSIEKSHEGIFTAGQNGVYRLAIANIGSASASGPLIVTDALPSGLGYVSAMGSGWSCSELLGTVTCSNSGPIAPGDSSFITLTVAVDSSAAPSVTNVANISVPGDVDLLDNTDADPTIVTLVNLALAKSHSGSFDVGTNASYTFTVSNVGMGPTSQTITVRDTLPAGLGFVSGSGVGWTVSATGPVVSAVRNAPLAAGTSAGFTITVSVGPASYPSVTNRATVESVEDGTPSNNTATDSTMVIAPDLSIAKSHSGDFTVGVNGIYDLLIRNIGTAPTFGAITVIDTLPVGLTLVSGSGSGWSFSAVGQVVAGSRGGTLAPGDTSQVALVVAVGNPAIPGVTNRAHVSTARDPRPANDVASDPTIVIGEPDLALSKTHAGNFRVGVDGTYDFTITNVGSTPTLGSITVIDTLPGGLGFVSGSGAGWSFGVAGQIVTATHPGPLGPSTAMTFSLKVSVGVSASPSGVNRARVSTAGDPNDSNDGATDPTFVDLMDVSLSKSHRGSFTVGINGAYDFGVTNVGSLSTSGAVTVSDTLPAGLGFVSGSGLGWSFSASGQIVTATHVASLAPGTSSSLTLIVSVGGAAVPNVTNVAIVSAAQDVNPANDQASDPTFVNGSPAPDLGLSKSHAGNFTVGVNGQYSFTVSNLGSAPTSGAITVADTLPNGLTFVSGQGPGWTFGSSGQVVTAVRLSSLAVGASSTFTLTVAVSPNAMPGVANIGTVATSGDGNVANDTATDPTAVDPAPAPDLAISKSHAGNFTVGVNGSYTLSVANAGSALANGGYTVTDTLPSGLTFVSGSGPGWSFSTSGQIVTALHPGAIGVGASDSFTLTVAVAGSAVPSVTNVATVSHPDDSNPANDSASDPTVVGAQPAPDLAISKSHAGNFTVGVNGSYTLSVANVGLAPTSGAITVSDTLPSGLSFVSGSGSGWSFSTSGQIVTALHLGPLAPSASSSFDLMVSVAGGAVPGVTNWATVRTSGDSNVANDRASDPTVVDAQPAPDLAISKSHVGNFTVGVNGSYTLSVANVGSALANGGYTVTDTLPSGLTFISGSGPGWSFSTSGQIVTALHPSAIGVGASDSFTLTVAVAGSAVPSVTNVATVSPARSRIVASSSERSSWSATAGPTTGRARRTSASRVSASISRTERRAPRTSRANITSME